MPSGRRKPSRNGFDYAANNYPGFHRGANPGYYGAYTMTPYYAGTPYHPAYNGYVNNG